MVCARQIIMQRLLVHQVSRRSFQFSCRLDMTFEGNKNEIRATDEERMSHYFGTGRLRGEPPTSSSRRTVGESRRIAGVDVPSKPAEPDNCCMSGCVNCVWELFNDDLRHWRQKRKEAAEEIKHTEKVWPADWNPPLLYLSLKNVPESLKTEKIRIDRQHENQRHKSTASLFPERREPLPKSVREAKKRNLAKRKEEKDISGEPQVEDEDNDEEGWQNVPVYIKAFAEFERKKKMHKAASRAKLQQQPQQQQQPQPRA